MVEVFFKQLKKKKYLLRYSVSCLLIIFFMHGVYTTFTNFFSNNFGNGCVGNVHENMDKVAIKFGIPDASSTATKLANQFIQALQKKDITSIDALTDRNIITESPQQIIDQLNPYINSQNISLLSEGIINFNISNRPDEGKVGGGIVTAANKIIEVNFVDKSLLDRTTFINIAINFQSNNEAKVAGIHFASVSDEMFKVSFKKLSNKQFLVIIGFIGIPLLILIALLICINTDMPKRKWLWILFILFGVGLVDFNWAEQTFYVHLIGVALFGVAYWKECYSPLILQISFPFGALLFFIRTILITYSKKKTGPE